MANKRVSEVFNNYENIKRFLSANIDDLLLEKFKSRCKISPRRLDHITEISALLSTLEKLGDLDAFNIQSVEIIMCSVLTDGPMKKDLQKLIRTHRALIDKCDNVVLPVRNQYAEDILNRRQENSGWNNLGRTSDNNYASIRVQNNQTPERTPGFTLKEQDNRNIDTAHVNYDICDQFSEVIELITGEIGGKWQEFARYLGLKDGEVEEIIYDPHIFKLKEKSRRTLIVTLQRIGNPCDAKATILEALSKVRRNDLKRKVDLMI